VQNRTILLFTCVLAGCTASAQLSVGPQKPSEEAAKPAETTPATPEAAKPAYGPTDNVACVGTVDAPPAGAKEVKDDELAKAALDVTGKGKLCAATVYEATAPVKVYRVWNKDRAYTELGKWWSLAKPAGPVDEYRKQNAICPEWSELNSVSVCTVKVGAHFVMGPGQSAACEKTTYEKSAVNQVFIPNDTRENKVFVENCEKLGAFP